MEMVMRIQRQSRRQARDTIDSSYANKFCAAMDTTMRALEKNCVSFTLWNYSTTHTREWGDGWNLEDLSIFSSDLFSNRADIYSGGRTLSAVVRPYALCVAGNPLYAEFDFRSGFFEFSFETGDEHVDKVGSWDSKADAIETLLFAPRLQYPLGVEVVGKGGTFQVEYCDGFEDIGYLVRYRAGFAGRHTIRLADPRDKRGVRELTDADLEKRTRSVATPSVANREAVRDTLL
eukprot:c18859_g2_i4.p1 GENE.c18859_g2_i4~~c18859_g2_i4.p1  ORF type:complete len:233 (+),score=59.61 c18859_g2_i4:256-954(+)